MVQRMVMGVGMMWAVGCGQQVTEEDCMEDEVFRENSCIRCGNAGGCAKTGPECLPTCDDDAFDCQNGVRVAACD